MKKRKTKNKIKLIFTLLIVVGISLLIYALMNDKISFLNNNQNQTPNDISFEPDEEQKTPTKPKVKIYNMESKTRPFAIMIDNEKGAWKQQTGLQQAYLVYEIIVEGGITRLLAIYKDQDVSKIGPVRSARHYYLDYALENDAVFTHFGYSPQALNDIKALKVNNISGTQADDSAFWRDKKISGWQNVYTTTDMLSSRAASKKTRTTSTTKPLLNYSVDEVELSKKADSKAADLVRIHYSKSHYVGYQYDDSSKTYKRYMVGNAHVDTVTGKQYTVKNLIVYSVRNYPLNDGSGKGRQGLDNLGSGTGYYITEGYSIPIKWEKSSRAGKTIYKDLEGNEIKVNDGNTFIHLQPKDQTLTIE